MFGHADCPESMLPNIAEAVERCYSSHGISDFYVGNRGQFDRLAAIAVKQAKQRHADICLYLLLAYHPAERVVDLRSSFDGSFYPSLENVPRRYAIVHANRYMADTSDYIICYVRHAGNTNSLLKYAQKRKREGIPIENVAEDS